MVLENSIAEYWSHTTDKSKNVLFTLPLSG